MFMISSHLSLSVRLCPLREIRSPYLGKVQQLKEQRYVSIPIGACSIFGCPDNGMAASAWDL